MLQGVLQYWDPVLGTNSLATMRSLRRRRMREQVSEPFFGVLLTVEKNRMGHGTGTPRMRDRVGRYALWRSLTAAILTSRAVSVVHKPRARISVASRDLGFNPHPRTADAYGLT